MLGCITGAFYTMKVDILTLQVTQDPTTRAMEKTWVISATKVPALVESIKSRSASERVSGERFLDVYSENDLFNLAIGRRLSKRDRISNVRDADGNIILTELDVAGNPATEFDVIGEGLEFTPFGKVQQYTYMIGRSTAQNVKP